MKGILKLSLASALFVTAIPSLLGQTTTFVYQGRLTDSGTPATGLYDLQFTLWDFSSGGNQVGPTRTMAPVVVSNGFFSVALDFGNQFNGADRWMQIGVRTNGSVGSYSILNPRQQLTPTPYSLYSANAAASTTAYGVIAGAVTGPGIANQTITGNNIAASTITGDKLSTGTITSTQLGAGSVGNAALASDKASLAKVAGTQMVVAGDTILVVGSGNPINTNLFTGLGMQYYAATGEGAIMSCYNSGHGYLSFYTRTNAAPMAERMRIAEDGNIGISTGTNHPSAALEVRGDVKLGSAGTLFASALSENVRIVRGTVNSDGSVLSGTGFTVTHQATGQYLITFNPPFLDYPTTTFSAYGNAPYVVTYLQLATNQVPACIWSGSTKADQHFAFIAIGKR